MKIALIRASIHRRGGAERYTFHLARGLAERGHEVHLYARRCEELPHPRVIFHRVPTLGGFSVLKVLSFAWSVRRMLAGASGHPGAANSSEPLSSAGAPTERDRRSGPVAGGQAAPGEEPSLSSPPIPRGHQKSGESRSGPVAGAGGHSGAASSSEPPSPPGLQRSAHVRSGPVAGYDVVHSLERVLEQDIYRAGDGLHREWLRVSAHYLPPWRRFLRLLNPLHWTLLWLEGRIFRGGARVVTANSRKGVEEIGRHFGLPPEEIPCLYNGVDLEEFSPALRAHRSEVRRRLGLGEEERVVLFVGTGYFRKGLYYLIQAIGLFLEAARPVRLVVAARGRRGALGRQARVAGAEAALVFAPSDVPVNQLYAAADASVVPSLYDPFPNVCLEALASGLPVVVSSRTGGAEIVTDGEDGLILGDPTDPVELSRLIERALDPEEGARLGANARRLAERFTIEANVEATEALYRKVLALGGRG